MSHNLNENIRKSLGILLRNTLKQVGPANKLSGPDDEKYTLDSDQKSNDPNAIKFNKQYFMGGLLLKYLVFDKIPACKNRINDSTAYEVFQGVVKVVYLHIKKQHEKLDKTLNEYLNGEVLAYAVGYIGEQIRNIKGKYKVILITDLIELTDIKKMEIGKCLIIKIDEDYLKQYPDNLPTRRKGASFLLGLLGPLTKDKLLEEHKNHVAIEIDMFGYHFGDEKSCVFDSAIKEIRLAFSYLFMCKMFLENVNKDQYTINTKDLKASLYFGLSDPTGVQEYYIAKNKNYKSLERIETVYEKILLSHKIITISNEDMKHMSKRCNLEQFNKIIIADHKTANKIKRAFDWFLKGVLEKDSTNSAIATFISLESLLATGSGQNTDEMGENIAIMLTHDGDERFKYKNNFKYKIYPLRNKIMHHGEMVIGNKYISELRDLQIYTVWSLRGILSRMNEIQKYGTKINSIREYFERSKLKSA